ncbi:MAG: hypothetical protein ABW003_29320, partial [Microvirga sp.]
GELLFSLGREDEALLCYDEALAAAEAQNANALYLRSAISRAAALNIKGFRDAGISQLEAAVARLPEATPTVDRVLAMELLNRLRGAA